MPQYKQFQYGLGQYGLFRSQGEDVLDASLLFLRSRFGVMQKGQLVYLYQHTPVEIPGEPKHMRLKTNTGETIYKKSIGVSGRPPKLRMKTNQTNNWLISHEH